MREDGFYRYLYFPLTNERIPFRLYCTLNGGWSGEWMGIELLNKGLLIDLFPDQIKQELIKKGFLVIGSRNLLVSVEGYNKLYFAGEDKWEEYDDLRIYAYSMDSFYDKVVSQLKIFFDALNSELKICGFEFGWQNSESLLDIGITTFFISDPLVTKIYNCVLHCLECYFDVCYKAFDGEKSYYTLIVSNLILFDNFAFKLMCDLYREFGNTLLSVNNISKKYISEWEKA